MLLVEEGLEGGNDDEFAVALDQALDELGPPAHADAGRSLGVGAGQGGDLVDLVGAQADQGRLSVQVDLDDDDVLEDEDDDNVSLDEIADVSSEDDE